MKKTIIFALFVLALFFLSACDMLFVDEEIREIAKSGSYTDCANLDTSENKHRIDECYSYVGKRQNDPNACAAASKNYKDSCYEDVAVDLEREDLCDEISSKNSKTDCFSGVAVKKKDPSICDNLEGDRKDDCYKTYSVDAGDFDSCAMIEDENKNDECYMHFAVEDMNSELCSDMNKEKNKDKCFFDVALTETNMELCDSIKDESKKENCYNAIESKEKEQTGECTYDSDCDSICEGDIMWKMGCDPRENKCIKTFDYDCQEQKEVVAGYEFGKVCSEGECIRDDEAIAKQKAELIALQAEISTQFKELNAERQIYTSEKYEAQNKCLDVLSDVTNKLIIDSSLKLASVANSAVEFVGKGGSIIASTTKLTVKDDQLVKTVSMSAKFTNKFTNDFASGFGDYTGKVTDDLGKIVMKAKSGNELTTEEAVEFYCGYNDYLSDVLDITAEQSENYQEASRLLREKINAFP